MSNDKPKIRPRVLAQATTTELEIIELVKGIGLSIAREGIDYGWSVATIAAVAYQRGLIEGVAESRRQVERDTKLPRLGTSAFKGHEE